MKQNKSMREEYNKLMAITDCPNLPPDELIRLSGKLIDLSDDLLEIAGIEKAFIWLTISAEKKPSHVQLFLINYFKGNAWNTKRRLCTKTEEKPDWDYESKFIESEITCFRNAIRFAPEKLDKSLTFRLCQIYTNLGNLLNKIGRFVEAIWYYDKAINLKPDFGMAIGNKAIALKYYGLNHYDHGPKSVLIVSARDLLEQTLNLTEPLEGNARDGFTTQLQYIKSWVSNHKLEEIADMKNHSLGDDYREQEYRKWCLKERLFLDPLNDLGQYPIAAQDVLSTPSMLAAIGEPPYLQGYFSWLKQEYVTARYLLYKGCQRGKSHFSDKEVLLYNTLDYPAYGYNTELIKLSFRSLYSLFDKIAYFINDYFKLNIAEKAIHLRTIWYTNIGKDLKIRPELRSNNNWPLKGLYWLSKDIYEVDELYRNAIEPESKDWREYRNSLEHKYLKITKYNFKSDGNELSLLKEPLALCISSAHFKKCTLSLARLVRAAFIYLSFSVYWEERHKANKYKGSIIPPMLLGKFDDDWKV
jgi:hypothetical protein